MKCLGLKPRAAGWKAQTNPLCYDDTPLVTVALVTWAYLSASALPGTSVLPNIFKHCLRPGYFLLPSSDCMMETSML